MGCDQTSGSLILHLSQHQGKCEETENCVSSVPESSAFSQNLCSPPAVSGEPRENKIFSRQMKEIGEEGTEDTHRVRGSSALV